MQKKKCRPHVESRELVYENPYQNIYKVHVGFEKFSKEIFVTDYGRRAGVIVEGPKGVLLTRQYRHLIDRISWEIPGGKVDPGEEAEEAARRECLEETGVLCDSLIPLLTFQPGLDTLHNPTHLFHTRRFERKAGKKPTHGNEVSSIKWVPLGKCISMISSGVIVDSLSIIGLLSYHVLIKK